MFAVKQLMIHIRKTILSLLSVYSTCKHAYVQMYIPLFDTIQVE